MVRGSNVPRLRKGREEGDIFKLLGKGGLECILLELKKLIQVLLWIEKQKKY